MTWVCLGMLVVLASCGAAMPKLPSQGGHEWRELKSVNVTLWTNASSKRGLELVHEMEERHQVITRTMNRSARGGRIFAIALRSQRELRAFVPAGVAGVAWSMKNPSGQSGVLLAADEAEPIEAVIINHELAYAISLSIIPRQPRWLAKGLASYFENASLDKKGEATIGIPRPHLLVEVKQRSLVPAQELFSCRSVDCQTVPFNATSWALLSYLLNVHYDRFGTYLQRLNTLPGEAHLRAWQEVFPDLPPAELDELLSDWVKSAALAVPRIKVSVKRHLATERLLVDADVLAARGLLYCIHGMSDKSRASAEAALAIDRTNLLASLLAESFELPLSEEDARRVVAAAPDDWRALALLATKLAPGPELEAIAKRACQQARKSNVRCELMARRE